MVRPRVLLVVALVTVDRDDGTLPTPTIEERFIYRTSEFLHPTSRNGQSDEIKKRNPDATKDGGFKWVKLRGS